jgi:GNAT superfamily N-acetyltransferase
MFTIVPASPADVPAAASALASAFTHDTVMGTLVDGEDRQLRLAGLFRALMRAGVLHSGRLDLAIRDTDGSLLGAAIWEQPGRHPSLFTQPREMPSFVRALGWRGLRHAIRVQTTLARHRPTEPHWYLAQIGVSAEARGAGVGSAFLKSRLEKVDAEGLPPYLEAANERNRALYRRLWLREHRHDHRHPESAPHRDVAKGATASVSSPRRTPWLPEACQAVR